MRGGQTILVARKNSALLWGVFARETQYTRQTLTDKLLFGGERMTTTGEWIFEGRGGGARRMYA